MVREVALALAGEAAVAQVNTEENSRTAGRFAVRGIPALVLLKRGRVIATTSGAQPKEAVVAWVRHALGR